MPGALDGILNAPVGAVIAQFGAPVRVRRFTKGDWDSTAGGHTPEEAHWSPHATTCLIETPLLQSVGFARLDLSRFQDVRGSDRLGIIRTDNLPDGLEAGDKIEFTEELDDDLEPLTYEIVNRNPIFTGATAPFDVVHMRQ